MMDSLTRDIAILVSLIIVLGLFLFLNRRREGRYLKKRGLEMMSPSLREEVEEERRINLEKKKKFEEAMKKAGIE